MMSMFTLVVIEVSDSNECNLNGVFKLSQGFVCFDLAFRLVTD